MSIAPDSSVIWVYTDECGLNALHVAEKRDHDVIVSPCEASNMRRVFYVSALDDIDAGVGGVGGDWVASHCAQSVLSRVREHLMTRMAAINRQFSQLYQAESMMFSDPRNTKK